MSATPDPSRCPLCGETNACGMVAGDVSPCWCKSVKIPAPVLERVPAVARDKACICERCATGSGGVSAGAASSAGGATTERRPLRVQ